MCRFKLKKLSSLVCYLLVGLFLLNAPLSQAVLCMETDGHSNIEFSVIGSCEKSLCEQSQSQNTLDSHQDNCDNCTDISLSQNFVVSKGDLQSTIPDSSFLEIAWVVDSSFIKVEEVPVQIRFPRSSKEPFQNSPLAHRQNIVLII